MDCSEIPADNESPADNAIDPTIGEKEHLSTVDESDDFVETHYKSHWDILKGFSFCRLRNNNRIECFE